MIQPLSILQFWGSTDETFNKGLTTDLNISKVPILANNNLLLPFQIKRAVTGNSITVFKLLGYDGIDDVDLIADVANIEIKEFDEGFEQLIYTAGINLSATVASGYYQLHIYDTVTNYYSNPFEVGDYPLATYDYGGFSDGFSDGFLIEGVTITSVADYYIFTFINFKDLFNKVYQFSYNDILVLDDRHQLEDNFSQGIENIEKSEETGKEIIENVYYHDEILVSFYHNKDVAEFMKMSRVLDTITIVDRNHVEKTITQFTIETEPTDVEEIFKINFRYKENYVNKNACNVDY